MSLYDGDVKITPTLDGGAITYAQGQPAMDESLSTAVYISLFTRRGWWGNALADPADAIGTDLEELESRALTNAVRQEYETQAQAALVWLVREGVAKSVTCAATIVSQWTLELAVTVVEPDGETETFRFRRNWQAQRAALEVN